MDEEEKDGENGERVVVVGGGVEQGEGGCGERRWKRRSGKRRQWRSSKRERIRKGRR